MALPSTGPLHAWQINQELNRPDEQTLSLIDPQVRSLAGRPSGAISYADLRGKSWNTGSFADLDPVSIGSEHRQGEGTGPLPSQTASTQESLISGDAAHVEMGVSPIIPIYSEL